MMYAEEDMLMLSGIQHFVYCPRQWALTHIEQVWAENRFTAEGQILHKQADDPYYRQKNGEYVSLRSVAISSKTLGLYGFSDVVELRPSDFATNCILHPSYPGFWKPFPIEYKRGRPKPDERDKVQLAAQVICLEEMYNIRIDYAYLFYWEVRRREEIAINDNLRQMTKQYADEMHRIFKTGAVPKVEKSRKCHNCSLFDICLPETKVKLLAKNYLKKNLYEETP